MKIYVAMPYGRRRNLPLPEIMANVYRAIEVGRELIKKGHTPFIPHLYHWVHYGWAETPSEDKWIDMCVQWVQLCDALIYIDPEGQSLGALLECQIAQAEGLPVFFTLEAIPNEPSRTTSKNHMA